MRRLSHLFAVVPFFAGSAVAQFVWDPTAEFSTVNGNPNGVWTYGWMDTGFTTFTPYVNVGASNWYGWAGDQTPAVWLNTSASTINSVPPGFLAIHPGNGNEPSVLRWTAPVSYSGPTTVAGQFFAGDIGTMLVAVRHNGSVLFSATDAGSFTLTAAVNPGDVLDFAVYGGYAYGNTPLQLTITGVPEPGSALLVALGLGGWGGWRCWRATRSRAGYHT